MTTRLTFFAILFSLFQFCNDPNPKNNDVSKKGIPSRQRGFGAAGDTTWQDPLIVRKGGTITGFYRSTTAEPAIWIQTGEPVLITGCVIEGAGERIIDMSGGSRTTITKNIIRGIRPVTQWGRAIYNWGGISCIIENNLLDHTAGMYFQDWQGTGVNDKIVIRFNEIYNIDGRFADETMGNGTQFYRQGVMFNQVRVFNSEISWNKFWNEPEKSRVEDVINMNESGGRPGSPLIIKHNLVRGAYKSSKDGKVDGSGNPTFTGTGFTTDGTTGTQSGYIDLVDNSFISTQNAAMNMWRGTQVRYMRNRIVSSGMMPDGTKTRLFWGGVYMSDNSDGTNRIIDNYIGFQHNRDEPFYPYPGRHDENNEPSNKMPHGLNKYWPNVPITLADEAKEVVLWQKKVADSGIVLGLNTAPPPVVVDVPTAGSDSVTVKVGQIVKGQISAVDITGKPTTTLKKGAISYVSNSASVFGVAKDTSNELVMIVRPLAAGRGTGTVTTESLAGKSLTRSFVVKVPAGDAEAIQIKWLPPTTAVTKKAKKK